MNNPVFDEHIKSLVGENTGLLKEVARLKDELQKEKLLRESAENKYNSLCERCISFYITERDITTDTIQVQTTVPRFMTSDDFTMGISQHLINICNAEREKAIFSKTHLSAYSERR